MKCKKCQQDKEESEFYWRNKEKGIRRTDCKVCCEAARDHTHYYRNHEKYKALTRARNDVARARVRDFVLEYLEGNPCTVCGESDPVVLEFHHRNSEEKEHNVSKLIKNGWVLQRLKDEIEKCDVVCANCHKRLTAKQYGSYKLK